MADGNASPPGEGPDASRAHSELIWQPRANEQIDKSVAQYSRFVARMKIALPVAAGLILLLVLILPQIRSESDRFRIGLKNVSDIANDTLSMVNARYIGTDDNGEPFSVIAQGVHERPDAEPNGSKLIDLTEPRAELTTDAGAHVKVNATTGVYDRKDEVLDLAGKVELYQDNDYEMHTTQAHVLLKDNVATGKEHVTARGSFGDIEGTGFTARQQDKVLIFHGPVTLVLKNQTKTETSNASSASAQPADTKPATTQPANTKSVTTKSEEKRP